jgi:hypothetical protein
VGKLTHLGMSGHLAVMSELLRLGYNVAMPYVDVGEDIYVIDDMSGELRVHVQVKTATAEPEGNGQGKGQYLVRKNQLKSPRRVPLYFVFALLTAEKMWDFIVLKREELGDLRERYEEKKGKETTDAKHYGVRVLYTQSDARIWDESLQAHRGHRVLERYFPPVTSGPGNKELGASPEE